MHQRDDAALAPGLILMRLEALCCRSQCVEAMRKAGFEILEVTDLSSDPVVNPVPWYGEWVVLTARSRHR